LNPPKRARFRKKMVFSARSVSENVRKLFKILTLKLTRDLGEMRKMRSDYGLYGVAIICFLLAAAFAASVVPGYTLSGAPGITVTVVFLLIGIVAAAVGYSARPRAMMPSEPTQAATPAAALAPATAVTVETTEPVAPPPPPVEEVLVSPERLPTQPSEPSPPVVAAQVEAVQPAPAEATVEQKPKPARRRRKKAAA